MTSQCARFDDFYNFREVDMELFRAMPRYKRLIMLAIISLVFVGVYDALKNLPVVTGCAFYGACPVGGMANPPSKLGLDPVGN